jgi:LmbE family N-acetylglucosaminyl deacetylase
MTVGAGLPAYDRGAPELVLAAHLDDAPLSCWTLLSDQGRDVDVATVFAGAPAESGYRSAHDASLYAEHDAVRSALGPEWDSSAMVGHRRAEDRAALALAGRSPIHLGFLDGQYEPWVDRGAERARFGAAVAGHRPRCSRLHLPLAAIGAAWAARGDVAHADHVTVRTWGRDLARAAGIPVSLYADLPYGLRADGERWPRELGLEPFAIRLPDAVLAEKRRALSAYTTQWPFLRDVWRKEGGIDLEAADTWRYEALVPSQPSEEEHA